MGGEIQLAGIDEGVMNPLVISDGDQGAGGSGRRKELRGWKTVIQGHDHPAGDFCRPTLDP